MFYKKIKTNVYKRKNMPILSETYSEKEFKRAAYLFFILGFFIAMIISSFIFLEIYTN